MGERLMTARACVHSAFRRAFCSSTVPRSSAVPRGRVSAFLRSSARAASRSAIRSSKYASGCVTSWPSRRRLRLVGLRAQPSGGRAARRGGAGAVHRAHARAQLDLARPLVHRPAVPPRPVGRRPRAELAGQRHARAPAARAPAGRALRSAGRHRPRRVLDQRHRVRRRAAAPAPRAVPARAHPVRRPHFLIRVKPGVCS